MYTTVAIMGIVGGILCAVVDFLWDLNGADNKKFGEKKLIYSAWNNMPEWRLILSAVLAVLEVFIFNFQDIVRIPDVFSMSITLIMFIDRPVGKAFLLFRLLFYKL